MAVSGLAHDAAADDADADDDDDGGDGWRQRKKSMMPMVHLRPSPAPKWMLDVWRRRCRVDTTPARRHPTPGSWWCVFRC